MGGKSGGNGGGRPWKALKSIEKTVKRNSLHERSGHLTTGRFQQAYVWVPSHGEKRFAALKLLRASTNATSHGRYASTRGCGSALRGVLQMLRRRSKRSRLPNRHRCRHRRPSQAAVSQRVAVLFASRRWRSPWQLFLAVIAFASAAACMFAVLILRRLEGGALRPVRCAGFASRSSCDCTCNREVGAAAACNRSLGWREKAWLATRCHHLQWCN